MYLYDARNNLMMTKPFNVLIITFSKSISKGFSIIYSLNHHLKSHYLSKNQFYIFIVPNSFSISCAQSGESSFSVFG
jgi:hypothetical protein